MFIAIVPIVVLVIGLLIYVLATHAKLAECGRLAYFAGLLVTLFVAAQKIVKL